jgi:hypothetical protein
MGKIFLLAMLVLGTNLYQHRIQTTLTKSKRENLAMMYLVSRAEASKLGEPVDHQPWMTAGLPETGGTE